MVGHYTCLSAKYIDLYQRFAGSPGHHGIKLIIQITISCGMVFMFDKAQKKQLTRFLGKVESISTPYRNALLQSGSLLKKRHAEMADLLKKTDLKPVEERKLLLFFALLLAHDEFADRDVRIMLQEVCANKKYHDIAFVLGLAAGDSAQIRKAMAEACKGYDIESIDYIGVQLATYFDEATIKLIEADAHAGNNNRQYKNKNGNNCSAVKLLKDGKAQFIEHEKIMLSEKHVKNDQILFFNNALCMCQPYQDSAYKALKAKAQNIADPDLNELVNAAFEKREKFIATIEKNLNKLKVKSASYIDNEMIQFIVEFKHMVLAELVVGAMDEIGGDTVNDALITKLQQFVPQIKDISPEMIRKKSHSLSLHEKGAEIAALLAFADAVESVMSPKATQIEVAQLSQVPSPEKQPVSSINDLYRGKGKHSKKPQQESQGGSRNDSGSGSSNGEHGVRGSTSLKMEDPELKDYHIVTKQNTKELQDEMKKSTANPSIDQNPSLLTIIKNKLNK